MVGDPHLGHPPNRLGPRAPKHLRELRPQPPPLDPWRGLPFRGCIPTARTLACLRIAGDVAAAGARLATDPSGLTQAGRVSHPPDDRRGFAKSSHP